MTTMTTVTREQVEQRAYALERANEIRTRRAEIKRELLAGEANLEALLRDPPAAIRAAQIGQFLEWLPGIGRWRANKILGQHPRITHRVTLENLSEQSVDRILARLALCAPFDFPLL